MPVCRLRVQQENKDATFSFWEAASFCRPKYYRSIQSHSQINKAVVSIKSFCFREAHRIPWTLHTIIAHCCRAATTTEVFNKRRENKPEPPCTFFTLQKKKEEEIVKDTCLWQLNFIKWEWCLMVQTLQMFLLIIFIPSFAAHPNSTSITELKKRRKQHTSSCIYT